VSFQGVRAWTVVSLAIANFLAASCQQPRSATTELPELPHELHGLELVEVLTGDQAREEIRHMHGKMVASDATQIGMYRTGDLRAVLFMSRFGTASDAESHASAMAERIGHGTEGFERYVTFDVHRTEVHSVAGHGQQHYFYVNDADLVWVSVSPMLGRPVLAELLHVDLEDIPRIVPL